MGEGKPAVVVFSTLFPSSAQPQAGLFIRERMFRAGRYLPITVVAPAPWFPLQFVIRWWRPHFRPPVPRQEVQAGVAVLRPRFLSFPGIFKRLDGLFLAIASLPTLFRLKQKGRLDLLDAHFAYPDGYAATLIAGWLGVPCTITLRGTEARLVKTPAFRRMIGFALARARRIFSVSTSLAELAKNLGLSDDRVRVIGNGVDAHKFSPVERSEERRRFGIPRDAKVLITVGALVERKGFHRVIGSMARLAADLPNLHYLIVGGGSPEGNIEAQLREQAKTVGLSDRVHFLGPVAPEDLRGPLSAADVFVLSSRNEGWANVLLEAMACGLPVITTDVGGSREVVCYLELGIVIPFNDPSALDNAIRKAVSQDWDATAIRAYALRNSWDERVNVLVEELCSIYRPIDREGWQDAQH